MRVPAPVSTRSTIPYSALFTALLTLSLGACQKKEETTPMPETAAPVAPVPEPAPSPAPEMPPSSSTPEPLPPADSSQSPTTPPPQ